MAERPKQLDSCGAAGRDAAVRTDEVPGGEPLVLGKRLEERVGCRILERQQGEPSAMVKSCDGTRREAAEASASVVEEHWSAGLHASILPRSRP
jgi:hypothetical protein